MIPPVIHFIWISLGESLTDTFKFCILSAVKNTSCQVVLHTDDKRARLPGVETRLRKFPNKINGVLFDPDRPLDIGDGIGAPKAVSHLKDIIRLEILYKEGGIYSDLDIVWLRNPIELMDKKVAIGFSNKSYKVLQNSTIFAEKGQEAIKMYMDWLISIFPCKRYATPANPYKLWKDRKEVFMAEKYLLNPVKFSETADIKWTDIECSICFHLSLCKKQPYGGEAIDGLKEFILGKK